MAFWTGSILYTIPLTPGHVEEVPVILPGVPGIGELTVIVISVLVKGLGLAHGTLEVIESDILSPLTNVELTKVFPVAPETFVPFIIHWYTGPVPPLIGVTAENVTATPGQVVSLDDVMETEGTTTTLTVVLISLLVPGITQSVAEVTVRVIRSLFDNPVVVYVASVALVIGLPFKFHWYKGAAPPFVNAVTLKVTLVPSQMLLSASLEVILTLTGKFGFTNVVIALLVAGLPVVQVSFETITTETVCPSVKPAVV
jgi:hypothetical protein